MRYWSSWQTLVTVLNADTAGETFGVRQSVRQSGQEGKLSDSIVGGKMGLFARVGRHRRRLEHSNAAVDTSDSPIHIAGVAGMIVRAKTLPICVYSHD